ncbi:RNA polymerase Rpc34 [Basidiobolus meristosporus CBS 931.73]|uniref:DNA-directed RNA polymerase III subunit RPC6 n=1 Tax=Basidiobolus meristosporus CBS 931.73 TaxID=1314790 RepID=A0A1Y1YD23_9FUNG|nr:RNA polymerase Rpc34 [Basidiobolus meristosporus CBS 931.73]|eukprot:ORX95636.1 RNA polymerase Rpc34 [Basidiobolus meristosporus CBS 931.73]
MSRIKQEPMDSTAIQLSHDIPAGLSHTEALFLTHCKNEPKGLTDDLITKLMPDQSVEEIAEIINKLSKRNFIEIFRVGSAFSYRAVNNEEVDKMSMLEGDERLIYQHIKSSGNEGIWTKNLKMKTNLHQQVVMRCLKTLEQKMLIKAVKSVKNPTRKVYMLIELTPSVEITGGPWFTDQELDVDFIDTLAKQCYKYIYSKSFPRNNTDAVYSTSYAQYPTANQIRRFIVDNRISTVDLSMEDIVCLLDVLVYDGKIERILPPVDLMDWDDEKEEVEWMYKAVKDRTKENSLTEIPCGKCPVFKICSEEGPISPSNCLYYKQWLEF